MSRVNQNCRRSPASSSRLLRRLQRSHGLTPDYPGRKLPAAPLAAAPWTAGPRAGPYPSKPCVSPGLLIPRSNYPTLVCSKGKRKDPVLHWRVCSDQPLTPDSCKRLRPGWARQRSAWPEGQKASENRLRLRTISRLGRLGFPPISRRRRVDGCLTTGEYSRNLGKRAFMLLMLQRE